MAGVAPTVTAVIPARMNSARFPGKPLVRLLGVPMIEHVYRRTQMCAAVGQVFIATCDEEIRQTAKGFGAACIMTSSLHERATERVAEAAEGLEYDIIVMVQGDEPLIQPQMIDQALVPMLEDESITCVNLACRIRRETEHVNPNTVKVVFDRLGRALYFSREPLPTGSLSGFRTLLAYRQVCIIPFRKEMLRRYADLEPTLLEQAESVDMLRLLEHGHCIHIIPTEAETYAVDDPADVAKVERLLARDALTRRYLAPGDNRRSSG